MSDRIWTPPLTPPTRVHQYKDAISKTFLIYLTLVSTLFSHYTLLTYGQLYFGQFFPHFRAAAPGRGELGPLRDRSYNQKGSY